jgi:hypothetical protein
LFQGTGNVLQQSGNLFWDNTNNRLGVGTSIPISPIHILSPIGQQSTITLRTLDNTTSGGYTGINCFDNLDNLAFSFAYGNSGSLLPNSAIIGTRTATGVMSFVTGPSATVRATLFSTGNFAINTTTDAGFRLDVNGTARVQGQATIAGTTNASAGLGRNALINGTITATANTQTLVGLDIEPTFNTGAFTGVETLALRVTGFISNFTSSGATQVRIIGPSGSNKSLFFFNSSTTFASTRIYNAGTTNHLIFATGDSLSNPTDRLAIFASTGNVGINTTTDAGFRLDVNGTARVKGTGTTSATTAFTVQNSSSTVLLTIDDAGQITIPNRILTSRIQPLTSAAGIEIIGGIGSATGGTGLSFGQFTNVTNTSGTYDRLISTGAFAPTSGTGVFNVLQITGIINQTGGANGITRGLYINPTLTSAADFRAIETARGNVVFGNLPTSPAGLPTGAIWNDAGTLKIV